MAPTPPLVALMGATVTFGGLPVFEKIDLGIARGDKVCLVGRNGSGKSTLMKLLAGQILPDDGERFLQPGARVAYLAQEPSFDGYASVHDFVAEGLPPDDQDALHRVDAVLDRLSLAGDRAPTTLSGGEARRAALGRALVSAPDVLLLDEPTNHLDLPTIEWLEGELQSYRGGLLLISHDRAFLSKLSRRTLWLDRGGIRETERGFAEFETWQQEVFVSEEIAAHKLDRKIAAETQWMREGISARRTRNMGRVRALQQLRQDRNERVRGGAQVKLAVSEAEISGRLVIEAEHISKGFDTPEGRREVAKDFSTKILRGDRVGLIGPNGAGKTTLLKILTGQLPPDSGTVRLGVNLQPVYFDQRRASLDPEATIHQTLCPFGGDTVTSGGQARHVASYMRDFLFDPRLKDTPTKALSGGERNRLLLATLFARPSNLMILDEPTNDLDMDTLDLLEEVLSDYDGTLLLVSHDRDFLDRLVTSVIAVEGAGEVQEYVGGYSDYAIQRQERSGEAAKARRKETTAAPASSEPKQRKKLGYQQQRELDQLPKAMEDLTKKIRTAEAKLADADFFSRDPAGFQKTSEGLSKLQAELEAAEERWLELEALREELEASSLSRRDMLLALIVMVIWGFNFAVAKFGLREFSPMFLMCLRFTGVAVVLLPFVRAPWGQMKEIFILSVLLGSLHFPLMFTGLTGVDAATASIAIQLQVPFSSILAAVLYRDKLGWKRGLGMAISFGGVIVIAGEPRALDNTFYLGLVIVAALVFSIVNIQIRRIGDISGFTLNGWMALMAAPQLLVATLVMESGQWEQLRSATWLGWSSIAYMAVMVTIVSYLMWYPLVRKYPVNQTMPWTLLAPVFGVLSGIVVLGEPMTPAMVIGGALTLVGVAVIVIRKPPKQSQSVT